MGKIKNILGDTFGRLKVISMNGFSSDGKAAWKCVCICGNGVVVSGGSLRSGLTKSCGCLHKERATCCATKHGKSRGKENKQTPEYTAYNNARARCNRSNLCNYKYYGGRGIKFLFKNFEQFFSELGYRPSGKTVDRIDNNGHYAPGNVRWATKEEQNSNKRAPNGHKILK